MDKHSGFTLAEVLITLAILGVIAALIIPNIIQNYQERVTVSKVKKIYSTLNNALIQAQLENGPIETWDIGKSGTGEGANKIYDYISPYLEITKDCENVKEGCFYKGRYKSLDGGDSWTTMGEGFRKVMLKDGIAVGFWSLGNEKCYSEKICIAFAFDINSLKGPNKVGVDFFSISSDYNTGFPYSLSYKPSMNLNDRPCNKNISSNNYNGNACLYWILNKGNMDYLKRDITKELEKMAN